MGLLTGKRVLVTRPVGSASKLAALLAAEGAEAVEVPAIELVAPASFCALDAALVALRSFDWLLLTSANAVEALMARARVLRIVPDPPKIAAIGPATARVVVESGLAAQVDVQPERFVAEGLLEALLPHAAGARMLLVRAEVAREVLPEGLRGAGAVVTVVEAYRTVVPQGSVEAVRRVFGPEGQGVDAITFTSASAVRNLRRLLEEAGVSVPGETVLASIGPVTSVAMREVGWVLTVESGEATLAGLVGALGEWFGVSVESE